MNAIGPAMFIAQFESIAEKYFRQIVKVAQTTTQPSFTLDISVEDGAQEFLRQKLLAAGFTGIGFQDNQRDGSWVEVKGNPYLTQNINEEAKRYVEFMNRKLTSAKMYGNRVLLDMRIPQELHTEIRKAFIGAGWKKVEFNSDQRDGDSVTLSL